MARTEKNLNISVLMDFYGPVLTQKQRDILYQYYDEDLSLAEIAENFGITRQGVRDAIKHGEAALLDLEQKLGYARHHQELRRAHEELTRLACEIRCANAGLYTPSPAVQRDTAEMLRVLEQINTLQEDA